MRITRCWHEKYIRAVLAASIVLLLACGTAKAQQPAVTVVVDENGNGTANGVALPLIGGLDCFGHPCLTYDLTAVGAAGSITLGFVLLVEPGCLDTLANCQSDVLLFGRFTDENNLLHPILTFFSDNSDGVDALADVGLPPLPLTGVIGCGTASSAETCFIAETGPEGNNGATYHPINIVGGGPPYEDPGFFNGRNVTYTIHSDTPGAAPEPATLGLLGLGLVALGFSRRKDLK